jgi:hypothetical protein
VAQSAAGVLQWPPGAAGDVEHAAALGLLPVPLDDGLLGLGARVVRVVVVDDEPMVCAHLRTILGSAGDLEVVDEAYDGAAGVEARRRAHRAIASGRAPADRRLRGQPCWSSWNARIAPRQTCSPTTQASSAGNPGRPIGNGEVAGRRPLG